MNRLKNFIVITTFLLPFNGVLICKEQIEDNKLEEQSSSSADFNQAILNSYINLDFLNPSNIPDVGEYALPGWYAGLTSRFIGLPFILKEQGDLEPAMFKSKLVFDGIINIGYGWRFNNKTQLFLEAGAGATNSFNYFLKPGLILQGNLGINILLDGRLGLMIKGGLRTNIKTFTGLGALAGSYQFNDLFRLALGLNFEGSVSYYEEIVRQDKEVNDTLISTKVSMTKPAAIGLFIKLDYRITNGA